jgi:hypothetical protein
MIIKQENIASRFTPRRLARLLTGLALVLLAFVVLNIIIAFIPRSDDVIFCDAETIALNGTNPDFIQGGYVFLNGKSRSSQFARSGSYSSRVGPDNKYGITHILKDAKAGQRYSVSVWRMGNRLSNAHLVVSIDNGKLLHKEEGLPTTFEPDGWEKIVLGFVVPDNYKQEEIKIYVYTNGEGPAYFDDLEIRRLNGDNRAQDEIVYDPAFQHLDLQIDDKDMNKLKEKRKEALREFVLFSEDDDWVKGQIKSNNEEIPVKLRLKGDQADHFRSGKYSFRVKVKSPHAWNRMLTFSLHSSRARYHLSEWFYHQWMQAEDVLATRYDFLTLSVNQDLMGVYAYEEHFEKQLVEFKSRREGPIVKFDEELFWRANARQSRMDLQKVALPGQHNSFESAEVQPFGESKILGSPTLQEQFKQAKKLMTQYQLGLKPASEVFDIDRLAKYYAIVDITEAYHSTIWHNQRFYYNPVTGVLEPIAFDGFTELGAFNYDKKLLMGMHYRGLSGDFQRDFHVRLFTDRPFVEKYIGYLFAFTEPGYIESFFGSVDSALYRREALIQKEFKDYTFDVEKLKNRARNIHALLPAVSNGSLRPFKEGEAEDGQVRIKAANYHPLPLEIIGYGANISRMSTVLDTPVFLPAYQELNPIYFAETTAPAKTQIVFFKVPGMEEVFHSRLSPWATAGESTPVQKIFENVTLSSNDVYQVEGKIIRFRRGKHKLDKDIIIPSGYTVEFLGGTEVDLIKRAKFISKSPVFMKGEAENPVMIKSSDQTANGFTVMEAAEKSIMHWVRFENMNTLDYEGWLLTGAVTFYESDVDIRHCAFLRNHCEDGLNIIRSEFTMVESLVAETAFDGFDADFCKGTIINCRFVDLGNDGMDFSGSVIEVNDSEVINAGDKGLSVGEESEVRVDKLSVDKAVTGVASKDLSFLRIDQLILNDCQTGIAAYQKKPEYGGARIQIKDLTETQVKYLHLIENGSTLKINGSEVRSN